MKTLKRRDVVFAAAVALAVSASGLEATAQTKTGYPTDYQTIIDAANQEGKLLIYTNMSLQNWEHAIKGFNTLYPGIVVDVLDVGSRESIERYLAESSTGVATADLIATASQPGWLDMIARGAITDYTSPESAAWPQWSRPAPGLYTISTDPLVFAWSALNIPEDNRPKTFAAFAAMAVENKAAWANKVTTYSPMTSPFGYVAHWYFLKHHGEEQGWKFLKAIGSLPARLESTGGPQMEKVMTGEYVSSYFMSGITVWPRMDDPGRAKFIGWNYIEDGQPMMMRGIGIPKASKNSNAARLMLDYVLSETGQKALGRGGLTPARPGVPTGDGVRATYSSVVAAVGEKNIILLGYDRQMMRDYDAMQVKLRAAYGQ